MRDKFPGYFRPTEAEFGQLWHEALIVPDANILLHLLRFRPETRQEIMDILKSFGDRLWVPHRVAFEFLRRWRDVDWTNRAAYETLRQGLQEEGNRLKGLFNNFTRHQVIDAEAERRKIDKFIASLSKRLDASEKQHPPAQEAEAIAEQIAALLTGKVGDPPSREQHQAWAKEGQARFDEKIPPGYADASKQGDDKFGDLYIWEELLAEAMRRSLPVIFVSDDRKDDWVLKHKGQEIGPRPELVQEFSDRTGGQRFYSYPLSAFLQWAKSHLKVEVSPKAIAEIEEEEARQVQREAADTLAAEVVARRTANDVLTQAAVEEFRRRLAADRAAVDLARVGLDANSVRKLAAEQEILKAALPPDRDLRELTRQAADAQAAYRAALGPGQPLNDLISSQMALRTLTEPTTAAWLRELVSSPDALRNAIIGPQGSEELLRRFQNDPSEVLRRVSGQQAAYEALLSAASAPPQRVRSGAPTQESPRGPEGKAEEKPEADDQPEKDAGGEG